MGRALIVGLGNPGPRYAGHRHNVGFRVVERLAEEARLSLSKQKFKGVYTTGQIARRDVALLQPQTFMNLSGQSVSAARGFFNVELEDILVIHDELDLPFGAVRLKVGGGHAGHNGLRSLVKELGSRDFVRLRVGIGRPAHGDVADYVLSDFSAEERPWLPELIERAAKAVALSLVQGPLMAMNTVNVA
ncbi:aminoacyl-tRNA hydrolase [Myxococcota bacterium]|nr:aminoacyl-tRNA hydrolase [Myxococcota bacterium]MBU1431379.1 aminoacyl-tRNA hydrolase [Myxococcota bacterium]MBU1896965.1 aminoacyl-tRNA hydrolase [Myxococcota bacterium]